jgi:hypothetical protein
MLHIITESFNNASSLTKEEQEDVETAMLEPGYEPLAQVSF